MSILESIQASEARAAETIKEANLQARDIIREAELSAQAQAAETLRLARENGRLCVEEAQKRATLEANAMTEEKSREYAAMAQKARENLPAAAAHIVERVVRA